MNQTDTHLFRTAQEFFPDQQHLGLTFDDVSLATLYSEILPRETISTLPLRSTSGPYSDSFLGHGYGNRVEMAIQMALLEGIITTTCKREQVKEVARVKNNVTV